MAVAVVFPGQGSQRPGMAQRWTGHPSGAAVLAGASGVLGFDVIGRWSEPAELADPVQGQLAVFVCGLAAHAALTASVQPVLAAGHSLGEYAALVAAGALAFEPALHAVSVRAQVMAQAGRDHPGGMLVLRGPRAAEVAAAAVQRFSATGGIESGAGLESGVLVLANDNAPEQVVLSGTSDALDAAAALAQAQDVQAIALRVSGAFHSPLMRQASEQLDPVLAQLRFTTPRIPVIPNRDGVPTRDPGRLATALRAHLLSPVRWRQTSAALGAHGARLVAECGASRVLGPLIQAVHPDLDTLLVRTINDLSSPLLHPALSRAGAA